MLLYILTNSSLRLPRALLGADLGNIEEDVTAAWNKAVALNIEDILQVQVDNSTFIPALNSILIFKENNIGIFLNISFRFLGKFISKVFYLLGDIQLKESIVFSRLVVFKNLINFKDFRIIYLISFISIKFQFSSSIFFSFFLFRSRESRAIILLVSIGGATTIKSIGSSSNIEGYIIGVRYIGAPLQILASFIEF